MDEVKNKNYLVKILLLLLIIFTIFYISNKTGYYEYKVYEQTSNTNLSIKEFENDVKNSKDLTNKKYISEKQDYSSIVSDTGYYIGNFLENVFNFGLKKTINYLNRLFYK